MIFIFLIKSFILLLTVIFKYDFYIFTELFISITITQYRGEFYYSLQRIEKVQSPLESIIQFSIQLKKHS